MFSYYNSFKQCLRSDSLESMNDITSLGSTPYVPAGNDVSNMMLNQQQQQQTQQHQQPSTKATHQQQQQQQQHHHQQQQMLNHQQQRQPNNIGNTNSPSIMGHSLGQMQTDQQSHLITNSMIMKTDYGLTPL